MYFFVQTTNGITYEMVIEDRGYYHSKRSQVQSSLLWVTFVYARYLR